VQALIDQSQKLTLSSRAFHNSVFGVFAKKLTTLFGYDMVLPMNTGAEAVETSLKLARKWAYKRKGVEEGKAIVLAVEGNFHGRTLGVIRYFSTFSCFRQLYASYLLDSMSTDPDARRDFGPYLEGVGPSFFNKDGKSTLIRFGVLEDLERALIAQGPNVAAFLVEPIQGEAG